MSDSRNPLDEFHEDEFLKGQKAVASEAAARRFDDHVERLGKVAAAAAETMKLADRLADDEDPYKQEIAALIKQGVRDGVKAVANGNAKPVEGREAQGAAPFLRSVSPQSTDSLSSSQAKALPDATNAPSESSGPKQLPEPTKRKRGRPKKSG